MTIRERVRQMGRAVIGPRPIGPMTRIIRTDPRSETFFAAVDYANYEAIPGDIVEFGVFAGMSLALLAKGQAFDPKGMERRVVGFDSFEGLPASGEVHARWRPGDCARTDTWHPVLEAGDRVTPDVTRQLFHLCDLAEPVLHAGAFSETLPQAFPARYPRVAIVHVDCDLYESTRDALEAVAPSLQDGAMLLFDDWFHYKGHPAKGEARAFHEFLARHPEWGAVHYRSYATFCNAFILHRV